MSTYNQFQSKVKGRGYSKSDIGVLWSFYKKETLKTNIWMILDY